jgi:MoaA/NifB/PqqE/SkfB family radical SAM enzyme
LLEAGITRFLVSLHGATPETHDAITHVPGSFFQAIRGIRNAQRHGQSKVRLAIHTVVLPGNYHELSSIVDLVFALGIPMLKFSYVVPVGEATSVYAEGGMPDLQHTMPFIQRAVDRFLLLYGSTPMTSIAIGYVPVCALSGYERFSDEFNAPPTFFINDSLELELADTLFAEQGLKVKREACARCAHARECGGVWREYVSHFGWDEFKPVAPR